MRTFRVIVGGNEYEVAIEEITEASEADARKTEAAAAAPVRTAPQPAARTQTAAPARPSPKAPAGEGMIVAAMPGTITDVKVNQGDAVKRGDTLLILEAMKMENEIKAPRDGIVATIEVTKGTAVNAGMALVALA